MNLSLLLRNWHDCALLLRWKIHSLSSSRVLCYLSLILLLHLHDWGWLLGRHIYSLPSYWNIRTQLRLILRMLLRLLLLLLMKMLLMLLLLLLLLLLLAA